jgi:hypothetical protein
MEFVFFIYLAIEAGVAQSVLSDYRQDDRGWIPERGKNIFLRPLLPDQLWCPLSLLSNGNRGAFPGSRARQGSDTGHSPPSSAEVKNESELYTFPSWRLHGGSVTALILLYFVYLRILREECNLSWTQFGIIIEANYCTGLNKVNMHVNWQVRSLQFLITLCRQQKLTVTISSFDHYWHDDTICWLHPITVLGITTDIT